MKAVFVFDQKTCEECPINNKYCDWGNKCPLRPLPKKLTETEIVNGEIHGYRCGWNDCLDEIVGEAE